MMGFTAAVGAGVVWTGGAVVTTGAAVVGAAGAVVGVLLEQLAMDHPEAYENIVQMAAETSELEQYRDGTDHLHIVARKKGA